MPSYLSPRNPKNIGSVDFVQQAFSPGGSIHGPGKGLKHQLLTYLPSLGHGSVGKTHNHYCLNLNLLLAAIGR